MRKSSITKIAICSFVLMMLAAGCGAGDSSTGDAGSSTGGTGSSVGSDSDEEFVGMTNPWTDHADLSGAEAAAGFYFVLPNALGESTEANYRCMEESMIEVIYTDKQGEEAYRIRKGRGSDDISGDYNEYEDQIEYTKQVGEDEVIAIISSDYVGVCCITFCVGDEFSYSFTAGTYKPNTAEAKRLIDEILEKNP